MRGNNEREILFACAPNTNRNKSFYFQIFVWAALFVFGLFLFQGSKGFSLWDEGYLWYGVQRTMLGEVPLRDFMAYDPGRYYWSAALMSLWGDNGIMSLRFAVAIFQGIGLYIGLLLVARTSKIDTKFLLLSAVILVVWMFPRHKLFDISLSIFLCGLLTYLISNPTAKSYLLAGIGLGLIAVFGRNHGAYGLFGSFLAMIWIALNGNAAIRLPTGALYWAAGVLLGFSPILLMLFAVDGYAAAFWQSIRFLFEVQTTNLPIPVPWPWQMNFISLPISEILRGVAVGSFFIAILVFPVISVVCLVLKRLNGETVSPALAAATFLAVPYAHYAFSRADVGHLALGIFPLLIGSLVVLANKPSTHKWAAGLLLGVASLIAVKASHPGWQCYVSNACREVEISRNTLQVDTATSNDIALLRNLADQYAPDGKSFMAVPFWPGAYALLERKAPIWEIYPLFHRTRQFEQDEIARIKKADPAFVIVYDHPLDSREELRYRNTHPFSFRYIEENFARITNSPDTNPAYRIYKANVAMR